jgi:hypothetical protein
MTCPAFHIKVLKVSMQGRKKVKNFVFPGKKLNLNTKFILGIFYPINPA